MEQLLQLEGFVRGKSGKDDHAFGIRGELEIASADLIARVHLENPKNGLDQ